ncbi:F-box and associated interaction domains-containing protein [Euphorbia peplus]|nr:F-box and associated interaction domains-containing protein [Euphorbia peplus]
MANLPQELVNEILLVLPVKSLLRFRCVSKLFYGVIDNKDFIYSHLRTSSEKSIRRKLIYNDFYNSTNIHTLDINDGYREDFVLDFPIPPMKSQGTVSCDGLLLISMVQPVPSDYESFTYKFTIWNPSTRYYRELPTFPVNDRTLSFFYDPTSDDYKVVLITQREVWIFELRSSSWRMIQDVPSGLGLLEDGPGFNTNCFVDGCVHSLWHGSDVAYPCVVAFDISWHRGNIGYPCIVAFDIVKETFSAVPQPNYKTHGRLSLLQAFEGRLSVGVRTEHSVDLYVRKKEGVEFCWTKLFSCDLQNCSFIRILGYLNEGDKVLLSCDTDIMYSYDLKETSLQKIEMTNDGESYSVLYTESLVPVFREEA